MTVKIVRTVQQAFGTPKTPTQAPCLREDIGISSLFGQSRLPLDEASARRFEHCGATVERFGRGRGQKVAGTVEFESRGRQLFDRGRGEHLILPRLRELRPPYSG
jgi:hypothetical protein